MMRRRLFFIGAVGTAAFFLWLGAAFGETPVFDEPMAGSPYPPKVAYGKDGSVVVAGTTAKDNGDRDWSISLYKRDGNSNYSLFWRRSYDGGYDDSVSEVAITSEDEIVVVGTTNNGKDDDLLVVVFSSDGNVKWQRGYPGPHSDKGVSVAVWNNQRGGERIAVGGTTNNGSDNDLLVLLYNGQGGMVWSNPITYDDEGNEALIDLEFSHSGNLLVLGNSGTSQEKHWVLVNYSPSGERDWVKKESGDGSAEASDLAVDEKGRALVCGTTNGGEGNDWIFVEYSSSGGVFWRGRYKGNNEDRAYSATPIPDLGWAIAGTSYVDEDSGKDGLLMAVDENGSPLWMKWLNGANDQQLLQVTGDFSGYLVAVGITDNGKDTDWWIGRYSQSGELDWEYTYDGGSTDENPISAVGPRGEVAVVGNTGEDWKLMVFGAQYGTRALASEVIELTPKETTNVVKGEYIGLGEIANGGRNLEFSVASPVFVDNASGQPLDVTLYAGLGIPTWGLFFFNQDLTLSDGYAPLLRDSRYPLKKTLIPSIQLLDESGTLLPGLPPGEYLFFLAALYGVNADVMANFDWSSERYMIEYSVLELR